MPKTQILQANTTNPLIAKLLEYGEKQSLSIDEMADKLDLSAIYLGALIQSKRDVSQLPIDKIRSISSMLGMSCLAALLLAGSLSEEDMTEQFA
jgi:cyanate lyase